MNGKDAEANHEMWLNEIRNVTSTVIDNEDERVPSHTALWRHWL